MELKRGDRVFLRPEKEEIRYSALVVSCKDDCISLELPSELKEIKEGEEFILIIERPDYYNEFKVSLIEATQRHLKLRWQWPERREFFRIDDIISITARRITPDKKGPSRIIYGELINPYEFEEPDPSINPKLWRLLTEINTKLNILMERLNPVDDRALPVQQRVNISAGGIRFVTDEEVSRGDMMEIKMLLPTCPPLNIITYGEVVRAVEKDGRYEVALSFRETEEEVREAILRYTLQKQRELLRKKR